MTEKPFWVPDMAAASKSQMLDFMRFCEKLLGRSFGDWLSFHKWSTSEFRVFWKTFLEWSGIQVEGEVEPVCEGDDCEHAVFFPRLSLSYSGVLLDGRGASDEKVAVIAEDETGRHAELRFGEMRRKVARIAQSLINLGVNKGDRIVAIARNDENAVLACLASAGIGATWSSVGPDLGPDAIIARFQHLEPFALFTHTAYFYQGTRRSIRSRLEQVVPSLSSLRFLVALDQGREVLEGLGLPVVTLEDLASGAPLEAWPAYPFNHPLFILFTSGTTGLPKCIVHGAGGTLLEHLKEHRLHSDFGPGDVLFFQTSTGWMMWNWQLSALASGTTIVLWDGSPTYPEPDQLWRVVARNKVTVFGTSPAYLEYCREAGLCPKETVDLGPLRAVQATGSILFEHLYDYVSEHIKHVPVQSISGGTDIIGCFVLGHPALEVWKGECQCISLGLDVREQPGPGNGPAELICANPFPSRPLGFYGDDGTRFHEAYFAKNPGVWTHGDFVRIQPRGSVRMLGRSDGVLNIRGIRIGPAEIYGIVAGFPEIKAALAVELEDKRVPGGTRLVLLVVMAKGQALERPLVLRIKKALAERASINHVPDIIAEVPDLPVTHSGKLSERAARDAVNGRMPANIGAIRNPESLLAIMNHPLIVRERFIPP